MSKRYSLNRGRFLRAVHADFSRLLVNTKASLLPNFLDRERPMVPSKRANVPYPREAMITCVIKSDFLNCKYKI